MKKLILTTLITIFSLLQVHAGELRDEEFLKIIKTTFLNRYSDVEINNLFSNGVWDEKKTAIVITDVGKTSALIYAFLKQENGSFLTFNISFLEKLNLGKLGGKKDYYDRFEIHPVIYEKSEHYLLGVGIITRAWKDGQRYTVQTKPVNFKKDGSMEIWSGESITNP